MGKIVGQVGEEREGWEGRKEKGCHKAMSIRI